MTFSDSIDKAYSSTVPAPEFHIPTGWYRARAVSVLKVNARTGSEGLRIEFVLLDEPYSGTTVRRDFWLAGKALPISRRDLETIGFAGLNPSQIEAFCVFDKLPVIRALIGQREFDGRLRNELKAFASDTPSDKAASPSPSTDANARS